MGEQGMLKEGWGSREWKKRDGGVGNGKGGMGEQVKGGMGEQGMPKVGWEQGMAKQGWGSREGTAGEG